MKRQIVILGTLLSLAGHLSAADISGLSDTTPPQFGYLEVYGSAFGDSGGEVLVGTFTAPVAKWTETEIVVYIPEDAAMGPTQLEVIPAQGTSDSIAIEIVPRDRPGERIAWAQRFDSAYTFAKPVVGGDGTIYVLDVDYRLYAVTPEGAVKWVVDGSLPAEVGDDTPIFGNTSVTLGADGTIYSAHRWYVSALNPDGSLLWRYDVPVGQRSYIVYDTKTGPDGNVYVGACHTQSGGYGIYSLDPTGAFRWNTEHIYDRTTRRQIELVFGPGPQGPQVYFSANQNSYALTLASGHMIFNNLPQVTGFSAVSPVDGTVHSSNYAYDPTGSIEWQSPTFLNGAMTMDSFGVHYATGSLGTPRMVALDPSGNVIYEREMDLPTGTSPDTTTISPDDTLLFMRDIFHRLLVLRSADGVEEWRIELPSIGSRPQYWLRRPDFSLDGSIAYHLAAVNAAGIVRDRTFLYAIDLDGGLTLEADTSCPGAGPATLTANGGSGGRVFFVYSRSGLGSFIVPNGQPCAGTQLGLAATIELAGIGYGNPAVLNVSHVPQVACGNVFIQALDEDTCSPSNVVSFD